MNLKMVGLLAALTLGGTALAQEAQEDSSQKGSEMQKDSEMKKNEMGGSGQQAQMGANELNGTVVGYRKEEVLIKGDNGAVVPLKLTSKTQVDGKPLNKSHDLGSHLKKEFKEGDQVRTSFDVQKDTNIARSVDKPQ